jgi:large conductance mechanosensitive channel
MKMYQEFKQFAIRGNVVDMAVGVILGGAFGKIVSSLVTDVIMPPIGLLLRGVDFADLKMTMKEPVVDQAGKQLPEVALAYGNFINTIVSFIIVALCTFILVKLINSLKRKEEDKPTATIPSVTKDQQLLTEIRDLLKAKA